MEQPKKEQASNSRNIVLLILAIVIVAMIAGVLVLGTGNDDTEDTTTQTPEQTDTAAAAPTTTQPTDSQTNTEGETVQNANNQAELPTDIATTQPATPVPPIVASATYTEYSQSKFNQARNQGKNVVLYFHATWCPTCKALDRDITNGLSRVPSNTEILKVDYDQYGDLKQTYGVRYQHTLVFFKGNSPSPYATLQGGSLDELIRQVETVL